MDIETQTRKEQLEIARQNLKDYFVGIDHVIDQVIDTIETWWCYPEFLRRPTIINLWGLTGSGKTDLVRRLSYELDMSNKFITIEMENNKIDPYIKMSGIHDDFSIIGRLYNNAITPQSQCILSFDDFHNYRSIYGDSMIVHEQYDDIWKLLSDGRLIDEQSRIGFIRRTIDGLREHIRQKDVNKNRKPKRREKIVEQLESATDPSLRAVLTQQLMTIDSSMSMDDFRTMNKFSWYSDRFLNTIGLTNDDRELIVSLILVNKDESECQELINQGIFADDKTRDELLLGSLEDTDLLIFLNRKYEDMKNNTNPNNEQYVYSKMLIFINGNIDELFHPKDEKGENKSISDISIDELYTFTKSVSVSDLKDALSKMFRPEQIARFGNNHIIYNSLQEKDFDTIIRRTVETAVDKLFSEYNIHVEIDKQVIIDMVKELGIFPAQGVRPVFSATDSVLASVIPQILIRHHETGEDTISWPFSVK